MVNQMKLQQWLHRSRSSAWSRWPEEAYKQERYQQRLLTVQEHLAECLEAVPIGSVHITSMCAGDGRDVTGVLRSHPRRKDVSARLVELDRRSVAIGVRRSIDAGLEHAVTFLNKDATAYATYKDIGPADIVLVCGVWGHVPTHERARLVRAITSLCKPGGAVIWTRGVSNGVARLHEIQSLFSRSSWVEVRLSVTSDRNWAVTTYRYCGPPRELPDSGQIFHFQRSAGR